MPIQVSWLKKLLIIVVVLLPVSCNTGASIVVTTPTLTPIPPTITPLSPTLSPVPLPTLMSPTPTPPTMSSTPTSTPTLTPIPPTSAPTETPTLTALPDEEYVQLLSGERKISDDPLQNYHYALCIANTYGWLIRPERALNKIVQFHQTQGLPPEQTRQKYEQAIQAFRKDMSKADCFCGGSIPVNDCCSDFNCVEYMSKVREDLLTELSE